MANINWETKGLEQLRDEKIKELGKRCNETIIGRFISMVNGIDYQFSNDTEAQVNFEKCDRSFEKGMLSDVVWTAYNMDGSVVRLLLTPTDFETIYIDHLAHIQDNIAKFRDILMPLVLSATIEELKNINWE